MADIDRVRLRFEEAIAALALRTELRGTATYRDLTGDEHRRAFAVAGAMKADLLAGGYIQADETTVPVQSAAVRGRNHRAYLWQYGRPGGPVI